MTKLTRVAPWFALVFFLAAGAMVVNTARPFSAPVRFTILGAWIVSAIGFLSAFMRARVAK